MEKRTQPNLSGAITSYTHTNGSIGVIVEVTCRSDFIARSNEFKELIHEIAMQIADSDPKFIRKQDVTAEVLEREKDIYRTQAAGTDKPPAIIEKIVEEKIGKFYAETCLYEQPFIRGNSITVSQLIIGYAMKLREDINVTRFARFSLGDRATIIATSISSNEVAEKPAG